MFERPLCKEDHFSYFVSLPKIKEIRKSPNKLVIIVQKRNEERFRVLYGSRRTSQLSIVEKL